MLSGKTAFSGFSTNDIPGAKAFYADSLGLDVTEADGMLTLKFPNGHTVLIYPKDDQSRRRTPRSTWRSTTSTPPSMISSPRG